MNTKCVSVWFILGRAVYMVDVWTKPANLQPMFRDIPSKTLDFIGHAELRQWYTMAEIDDAERHTGTYQFGTLERGFAQLYIDAGWFNTAPFHTFLENMMGQQHPKYYAEDYIR